MKWLRWLLFVVLWTFACYHAYDWLYDYEIQMWDQKSGTMRVVWYTGILISAFGQWMNWWSNLLKELKELNANTAGQKPR